MALGKPEKVEEKPEIEKPKPVAKPATKKPVAKKKEVKPAGKPKFSDMMTSMRKQTKTILKKREEQGTEPVQPKPKSFPDPTFKPKAD